MVGKNQIDGGLYLVPGPLGNLGDLTVRAREILGRADLICAEDTRRSLKLLNHLGLNRPLQSYREQNHLQAWPRIAAVLSIGGVVALMTDAGSPTISDPGAMLVASARAGGFTINSLPGPSAVITALAASGFSGDQFTFAGFLPTRAVVRREVLASLARHPWTLIFFEAPHRLVAGLADLAAVFGSRPALLAREMTKIHEELIFADLRTLADLVAARVLKGEITIVVEGFKGEEEKITLDMDLLRKLALADPRPTKTLVADLAAEFGRSRHEIYQFILGARKNG